MYISLNHVSVHIVCLEGIHIVPEIYAWYYMVLEFDRSLNDTGVACYDCLNRGCSFCEEVLLFWNAGDSRIKAQQFFNCWFFSWLPTMCRCCCWEFLAASLHGFFFWCICTLLKSDTETFPEVMPHFVLPVLKYTASSSYHWHLALFRERLEVNFFVWFIYGFCVGMSSL